MPNYTTNYLATAPDINISANCDTILAINLETLDIAEEDELIFVIKNYNSNNSPFVFMFRAAKKDINANNEILFKIPANCAQQLKPGAFYTFMKLVNAFTVRREADYTKITDNGRVLVNYGAQSFTKLENLVPGFEVLSARLEPVDSISKIKPSQINCELLGVRLETIES